MEKKTFYSFVLFNQIGFMNIGCILEGCKAKYIIDSQKITN